MTDEPSADRAQDAARERQHERTQRVEETLEQTGALDAFDDLDYPVRSEELAVEYGDQPIDLPNETETLGHVFDRLVDEEFDSPQEVREAVYGELTGEAGGREEYNDERSLEQVQEGERADGEMEPGPERE